MTTMEEDERRCVGVYRLPIGGGEDLVRPMASETARAVPSFVMATLATCDAFLPLDAHAARIRAELGLDEARALAVRRMLERAASLGLLVSKRGLLTALRSTPRTAGPGIEALGVVTKDRPEELERCVCSFADAARLARREITLVVCDDSVERASAANRGVIERAAEASGLRSVHVDREAKQRLARALVGAGLPRDVVDFCLFDPEQIGAPIGANRNAMLLATLGRGVLCVDDDVVCRVVRPPHFVGGLAVSSEEDVETVFYPHREAVFAAGEVEPIDIFGEHARVLGGAVAAELSRWDDAHIDVDRAGAELLHELSTSGCTVRATQTGYAGDSGTGPSKWLLGAFGTARRDWVVPEDRFDLALSSRHVIRAPKRLLLSDAPNFMGAAVGLDNHDFLPPFFPVGRNEDGIFAALLRKIHPDTLLGYMPFAITHLPPEDRRVSFDDMLAVAGRWTLADLVIGTIADAPEVAPTPAGRIEGVARHLRDVAEAKEDRFRERVQSFCWRSSAAEARHLRRLLEKHASGPAHWACAVERYLEAMARRLSEPDWYVPTELASRGNPSAAMAQCQRLLGRFGDLLEAWPAIRALGFSYPLW